MASSFAVMRLTGEYVLDHHSASQCNPLYDLALSRWRADWAEEVAPGLEFPRLLWPGEAAGRLSDEAAAETGLPSGVPVAAGTIDAWSEAFGAGVAAEGDTMLAYGTTMFIVHVAPHAKPDPRLWLTAGVAPGSRTVAAGMATSGALTTWFRAIAGDPPFEQLLAEAGQAPPGRGRPGSAAVLRRRADTPVRPDGPWGNARLDPAPYSRPPLQGATRGNGFWCTPQPRDHRERRRQPRRLVAVGGGTRGGLWAQVVSDVTGREQDMPAPSIGASYGDAQLAGTAAGLVPLGASWAKVAGTVRPNVALQPLYDRLYEIYLQLYPATKSLAHELAELQLAAPIPTPQLS